MLIIIPIIDTARLQEVSEICHGIYTKLYNAATFFEYEVNQSYRLVQLKDIPRYCSILHKVITFLPSSVRVRIRVRVPLTLPVLMAVATAITIEKENLNGIERTDRWVQ